MTIGQTGTQAQGKGITEPLCVLTKAAATFATHTSRGKCVILS